MAQAKGDVVVRLSADISPFQQGMASANRSMQGVEQRGRAMGESLSGAAGNVTRLTSAMSRAKSQMSSVQSRINSLTGVSDKLAGSARNSADAFRQFDRSRAQVDALRASIDPVFAASKRYEAAVEQLNTALRLGVTTQQEYDATLERLGQSYLTAGGQADAFEASIRGAGGSTANIAAQFNDIGVMMAAGQSPLMLAVQQGTQLNQVFAQMGGGKAALQGVGAGLMSMINPLSLATIGIIAGGAALGQWAISAMGAADATITFDDAMSDIQASMSEADRVMGILQMSASELREEYGNAAATTREFAVAQAQLLAAQASRRMADALAVANDELRDYIEVSGTAFSSGTMLRDAISNVARDFGIGRDAARQMSVALRDLSNATAFEDQQAALVEIVRLMDEYDADLSNIPPELARAISEMLTLQGETARAQQLMAQLSAAADGMTIGTMLRPGDGNLLPDNAGNPPPRSGGGGGGGGGGRDYASEFDQLQQSLMTETERVQAEYETRLENLRIFREQRAAIEAEFNDAELRINQDYANKMRDLELQSQSVRLGIISGMMGDIGSILEAGGSRNLEIVRGFKVAEAVITGYQAAVEAWSQGMRVGGPPTAALYTAGSLVRTGALISQMMSSGKGSGSASGGGSAANTSAAPAQAPLQATLNPIDPSAMYSGAAISGLLDALNEEAGDRGFTLMGYAA